MRRKTKDPADVLSEILEAAQKRVPDDFFDGDIEDELVCAAKDEARKMSDKLLIEKIEWLLEAGYSPSRLKEMIKDYCP